MDERERLLQAKRISENIHFIFFQEYQEILNKHEISSKQMTLIQFVVSKGFVLMNDIAAFLNATPSAASQAVRKLESEGYLKREINLSNRREIHVCLGEKGKELYQKMEEADMKIIEKYYMKLTPEEIEVYCQIVEKMNDIVGGNRDG